MDELAEYLDLVEKVVDATVTPEAVEARLQAFLARKATESDPDTSENPGQQPPKPDII